MVDIFGWIPVAVSCDVARDCAPFVSVVWDRVWCAIVVVK